jgi:hypothetical protein
MTAACTIHVRKDGQMPNSDPARIRNLLSIGAS